MREAHDEFIDGVESAGGDAAAAHLRAVLRHDGDGDRFLVDVQTDVMHDFVHGCLVSFIADESGASHALHVADRPAHAGNPRNPEIKHPLQLFVKP